MRNLMPEAFKGCLVFISNLSDAALENRISAISRLLEETRRSGREATGYHRVALCSAAEYLSLLEDQARSEWADREDQKELEHCRQSLAGAVPPSQENDKDSERQCDRDRLQKNIEDTERLIHLRRSARDAVEGQLSSLSAIQIDSYLDVVGVPVHDPIRRSLNGQDNNLLKAPESPSEPSLAQSFKAFAAETFIDLTAKYPKGVPAKALEPFAQECDGRGYLLTSDFLRDRVLKAIQQYNDDHPGAPIKSFSDLVAVLSTVSANSGAVKKRQKNTTQKVTRQFRVWLYENKRDYLKMYKKKPA